METAPQTDLTENAANATPAYWLTRFVILRVLGVLYAVAFLVAINQVIPLIGSHGLLPAANYLNQVDSVWGTAGGFIRLPSMFWFWHTDTALLTIAWLGLLISVVVVAGYANAPMLAILWFFYMS